MKILVTTNLPAEGFAHIASKHQIVLPAEAKFSHDELIKELADTDILISTFDYKIDSKIIDAAPRLRMIANFGVGFNNIDLAAATSKHIVVTNTPKSVIEPTAEHAFALLLGISHRVAELDRKMRKQDGGIVFGVMNNLGFGLSGKTLGIIGMGNIGKSVARRAVACGMKIIYNKHNRLSSAEEAECQAQYVSLDTLLKESDVVSLHMPYTPESHHIIDQRALSMMKPGSILINTARGACVDEAALIRSLKSRHLYGAALDVFEFEPHISPELFHLDNVLLSPHIGTGTIDGRLEMCHCVEKNINAFLSNDTSNLNQVNKIQP